MARNSLFHPCCKSRASRLLRLRRHLLPSFRAALHIGIIGVRRTAVIPDIALRRRGRRRGERVLRGILIAVGIGIGIVAIGIGVVGIAPAPGIPERIPETEPAKAEEEAVVEVMEMVVVVEAAMPAAAMPTAAAMPAATAMKAAAIARLGGQRKKRCRNNDRREDGAQLRHGPPPRKRANVINVECTASVRHSQCREAARRLTACARRAAAGAAASKAAGSASRASYIPAAARRASGAAGLRGYRAAPCRRHRRRAS